MNEGFKGTKFICSLKTLSCFQPIEALESLRYTGKNKERDE